MIQIETNISEVIVRLQNKSLQARNKLKATIEELSVFLKNYVVNQKLSGQVLNRRTGRLSDSIKSEVTDSGSEITGTIGTNIAAVPYAAIHEYGGEVKTRLGTGKGKPKKNGKATFMMPERSYLRSSLADNKDYIIQRITESMSGL